MRCAATSFIDEQTPPREVACPLSVCCAESSTDICTAQCICYEVSSTVLRDGYARSRTDYAMLESGQERAGIVGCRRREFGGNGFLCPWPPALIPSPCIVPTPRTSRIACQCDFTTTQHTTDSDSRRRSLFASARVTYSSLKSDSVLSRLRHFHPPNTMSCVTSTLPTPTR